MTSGAGSSASDLERGEDQPLTASSAPQNGQGAIYGAVPQRPSAAQGWQSAAATSLRRAATLPLGGVDAPAATHALPTMRDMQTITDRLARTLSGGPPTSAVPTFECLICCADVPTSERVVLRQCGRLAHSSCIDCLARHLATRLQEGRVEELCCPWASEGCNALAVEEELAELLEDEELEKCKRLRKLRQDPKLRECPRCHRLCSPTSRSDGGAEAIDADMQCADCGCKFCYYHSIAHEPGREACAQYERDQVREQLKISRATCTKVCPKCGILSQKIEGCNHMTCGSCKTNWCWLCGQAIHNVGWHYNPVNPAACQQFQEENDRSCVMIFLQFCCLPVVLITLLLLLIVVLSVVAFAPLLCFAGLLQGLLESCPCSCPCGRGRFCMRLGTILYTIVVFVPSLVSFGLVYIAHALIAAFLCCFLAPCGATAQHLAVMLMIPILTVLATLEGLLSRVRVEEPQTRVEEPQARVEEPQTAAQP